MTPQELADLAQQQTDETRQMEDDTARRAEAGSDAALAAVLASALPAWVAAFGSLSAVGAGAGLASYLTRIRADTDRATAGLGPRATRITRGILDEAVQLGARHVGLFAHRAGGLAQPRMKAGIPADAIHAAQAIADAVAAQLRTAARLLTPALVRLTGWRGVIAGVAAARRAVTMVRSAVAWCVHRAANSGAAQTIAALRLQTLWFTEPDACVRCLAYAGLIADADGTFPGGLAVDPTARTLGAPPIDGPPVHPGCRCKLIPWRDAWTPDGSGSLPALLRDRALRSIATGNGRPSESRAARLRAARALLAQPGIPATFRRQARMAVADGHF